jgi:HD-like signal output (HDOD) protein
MIGDTSMNVNLRELVTGGRVLALPQSAVQILQLSQYPDVAPAELAIPIESEPGLAAQVLRFVNSSYFGFSRHISTIRLAIALAGVRPVKHFVLGSAVFSSIPDPKCGLFDLKRIWQDSLRRALFARSIAEKLGVEEAEEPFTAALLQDVALPLLVKAIPHLYGKLFEELRGVITRLSDMEQQALGWTHAQAGGMLCRQWNLPERLASLVENHLGSDRCISVLQDDPGSAAVALSALLPSVLDPTWRERDVFEWQFERTMPCNGPEIADLFSEVDRQYDKLAPILKLPLSQRTLTGLYGVSAVAEAAIGLC